jgi:hypothetical protein
MNYHYYAQRKFIKDGAALPAVNKYGTREEMERQFHLFCASAATNVDGYEVDTIEWGTVEQGAVERKVWTHEITPEVEPEPVEEA